MHRFDSCGEFLFRSNLLWKRIKKLYTGHKCLREAFEGIVDDVTLARNQDLSPPYRNVCVHTAS